MILTPTFLRSDGVGEATATAAGVGEESPVPETAGVAEVAGIGETTALPVSTGRADGAGVGLCANETTEKSDAATQIGSVHCRAGCCWGFT